MKLKKFLSLTAGFVLLSGSVWGEPNGVIISKYLLDMYENPDDYPPSMPPEQLWLLKQSVNKNPKHKEEMETACAIGPSLRPELKQKISSNMQENEKMIRAYLDLIPLGSAIEQVLERKCFVKKLATEYVEKSQKICDVILATPNLSENDKEYCKDTGQSFEEFKAELIKQSMKNGTMSN